MNLVIVESPAKARTIEKFLGKDFKVESSFGHVRDLPKSDLGVDVENDFQPKYVIPPKAKKQIGVLKKLAEKADKVILATDEDREGEAIAWHLAQALGLQKIKKEVVRIVFHEITLRAILEALKNPRGLLQNLVDAQQARRVLDRLVGYKLSPLLWKKVSRGLSAGRVQSVAVRLVVEREREREKFQKQEYWDILAKLQTCPEQLVPSVVEGSRGAPSSKSQENIFEAKLAKVDGQALDKFAVKNQDEAEKIVADLAAVDWKVIGVEKKETKRNALPPFTTSTLQQSASSKLGFSAKRTMVLAQQLYEGADINGDRTGLITYMRTDSLNLSQDSLAAAAGLIREKFGLEYLETKTFKTKSKGAQEAHEAIRPTDPFRTPQDLVRFLDPSQLKLYRLIWQRFVASQMSPSVFDATAAEIAAGPRHIFKANGLVKKFDGFTRVYSLKTEETILPELKPNEELNLIELKPNQHFTEPPARYSEATLVKALEQHGIGRPSTYAPTLSVIQERGYVAKDEQKKFQPTQMGVIVNDLLVENFPQIVDINFTAKMEEELDDIAEGKTAWVPVIKEFYEPFAKNLEAKMKELKKTDFKKDEPTDKTCPECGRPVVIKLGRFGRFYACSGFPECRHTERLLEKIDMKCPKCGEGEVVVKRSKRGKTFFGCSRYPACDYASWTNPKTSPPDPEKQT